MDFVVLRSMLLLVLVDDYVYYGYASMSPYFVQHDQARDNQSSRRRREAKKTK